MLIARAPFAVPYLLFTTLPTRSIRSTQIAANRYLNSSADPIYPTTPPVSAYLSWSRQHSRLINIEEIPAGSENEADTKLLWGGHWKEGGKVLLYLHGGGYVMPLVKQ
jgi:acetyl esterase/lipase